MSISRICDATHSESLLSYRKPGVGVAESATANRNAGPDTVFFSEDALKAARRDGGGSDESGLSLKSEPDSEETRNAEKSDSSASGLGRKNLFSMVLESLFLAELEESAAGNAETASAEGEQAETPPQRPQAAKSASPLEDGGKVAEIKKTLADFAKGKSDASDLLKAMAVPGGGREGAASAAGKSAVGDSAGGNGGDKKNDAA